MKALLPAARVALFCSIALGAAACGASAMNRETLAAESHSLHASNTAAATAFDEGVQAFDRGELARATTAFETAYRASPNATVAFNLARVHDRMGHARTAANYYLAFLAHDVSPDRSLASEARAAIDRLRTRLALLRVYAPSGAMIDGESLQPDPYERWIAVDPGLRPVQAGEANRVVLRANAGDVLSVECPRETGAVVVGTTVYGTMPLTARVATASVEDR